MLKFLIYMDPIIELLEEVPVETPVVEKPVEKKKRTTKKPDSPDIEEKRQQLSILAVLGTIETYTGVKMPLGDVKKLSAKDVETYYNRYQVTMGNQVTGGLVDMVIEGASEVINMVAPIDDKKELCEDLKKNDLLKQELNNAAGYAVLKGGRFVALGSCLMQIAKHINLKNIPAFVFVSDILTFVMLKFLIYMDPIIELLEEVPVETPVVEKPVEKKKRTTKKPDSPDIEEKRQQLSILAVLGTIETYTGVKMPLGDVKKLSAKDVETYYNRYQVTMGNQVTGGLVDMVIEGASEVINMVAPIDDKKELCEDLKKNDLLKQELNNAAGYAVLKGGRFVALGSCLMQIAKHIKFVQQSPEQS
ncbi:hypothetical protein AC249_AIPGENE26557 [Exaiptasia diaphana]|nr:hypothetical protein AC249_AIPGENE26557 [Exaiptasia diaphana]